LRRVPPACFDRAYQSHGDVAAVLANYFVSGLRFRHLHFFWMMAVASLIAANVAGDDGATTTAPPSSSAAMPAVAKASILWGQSFRGAIDWQDPQERAPRLLGRVYSVQEEGGCSFLHARHDSTASGAPPALHYGKAFTGLALRDVRALRWRWRARTQPTIEDDPWQDMAASIYVVTKTPTLLRKGRGFKFGWLARPAPSQTFQRGLLQVALRSDPPSNQWRTEEVDLCALHRRTFGPCENEQIIYIGVLTDADGTKSVAEGDYADFEIVGVH
jgi:hypothetical protein